MGPQHLRDRAGGSPAADKRAGGDYLQKGRLPLASAAVSELFLLLLADRRDLASEPKERSADGRPREWRYLRRIPPRRRCRRLAETGSRHICFSNRACRRPRALGNGSCCNREGL